MEDIFSLGSCLNFHLILKRVYPGSIPLYNINHIITKIEGRCYDITGCVSCKGYSPFSEYYNKKGISKSIKQMMKYEHTIE